MSKPTEFHRWFILSETQPGRRIKSTWHMTREQAMERDPTATPIPGTMEVRDLPESLEETLRDTHNLRGRPKE